MFWFDGEIVEDDSLLLKIDDPGLLYGATTFTTLRIYDRDLNHPLTNWQLHCDRLGKTLQSFAWQMPDWERLRRGAEILLNHYPVLRIAIFMDGREWITGRSLPEELKQRQQQGTAAWIADDPLYARSLAAYKTGNYLTAWMALQKAKSFGAQEAILLDEKGNWLETSTGNLWGWQDGCWWTPALEGRILPGIARSQLIRWLRDRNIPYEENIWTPAFVQTLDAIAYSNSVIEIVPFAIVLRSSERHILDPTHPALEELRGYFAIGRK